MQPGWTGHSSWFPSYCLWQAHPGHCRPHCKCCRHPNHHTCLSGSQRIKGAICLCWLHLRLFRMQKHAKHGKFLGMHRKMWIHHGIVGFSNSATSRLASNVDFQTYHGWEFLEPAIEVSVNLIELNGEFSIKSSIDKRPIVSHIFS